ncbi:MAG: DUF262 domain-containing protein, partial [Deltaproteobacteria bacterium]|nr:DUF262 domain-containing protein [Deltaproteobacteria bacterium]
MDEQLVSLSKIFTERIFRIPDYQRGYSWGEKQLKDFWNDLAQLDNESDHYTGVLTLETVPEEEYLHWQDDIWIIKSKRYRPFFVVDGQQRLTTAIILIQTIIEQISEKEKLNYDSKKDISRKFIFDSKDNGISRSYIFGYQKDNPSYETLKTKVFCEKSHTAEELDTVYAQNLEHAKTFFKKHIKQLQKEDLGTIYTKISQQLLFNLFTITREIDVCVAFETMNNRGKPLSQLELLKNRLIYLSLKFNDTDEEKLALRNTINNCWKSVYHNLGRNKENPLNDDQFLQAHYFVYFGDNEARFTTPYIRAG